MAPSWQPLQLAALEDATLFSYSDRPVQAALGVCAKRAPTERAAPARLSVFRQSRIRRVIHVFVFAPAAPVVVPVAGSADRYPVRRVYCVGRNYAAHAREMGFDLDREPPLLLLPADAVVPVA